MKKNGFTLIELLAIIVILAIIAVITVPIILGIIEDASENAAKDSAYGYEDAVNKYYAQQLLNNQNLKLNDTYTVTNGTLSGGSFGDSTVTSFPIQVSGTVPSSGKLHYTNNVLDDGCLVIGNYKITFKSDGSINQTEKGNCDDYVIGNPYLTDFSGTYSYAFLSPNLIDGAFEVIPYWDVPFNSDWHVYLRKDTSDSLNPVEVCGRFDGGTVCIEGNRWDCGEIVNEECSNSNGYIANKKLEAESKGAYCGIGWYSFSCSSDGEDYVGNEIKIYSNGGAEGWDYTRDFSEAYWIGCDTDNNACYHYN